jgi:PTS system nitrogen regulatory IIA component
MARTMSFRSMLDRRCTHVLDAATSKKRLLETLADSIAKAHPGLDARTLFDQLMARERLGSTGLGDGVAIPHCRLAGRDEPVAAFAKLAKPLAFDSPDGQPVDLVFVLAVPEEEHRTHLNLLARLAQVFGDGHRREQLRACADAAALHERLLDLLEET